MLPIAVSAWSEKRDDRPVVEVNRAFVDGVSRAGGTPVVVPIIESAAAGRVMDGCSGLVLTGGIDVDPAQYNAERDPNVTLVDPERDDSERGLVEAALERGLPVLGLCRGAQLLNVARGGTLIQHLPDVSRQPHSIRDDVHVAAHDVKVLEGSLLEAATGKSVLAVNTLHHQAVDTLGDDLVASAWAGDETVEAIEDRSRALLGVQWHPELMLDHPDGHLALFEWLVGTARG